MCVSSSSSFGHTTPPPKVLDDQQHHHHVSHVARLDATEALRRFVRISRSCLGAHSTADGGNSGSLKHACPKGIYVAPVPEEPLLWTGVLFVRKGEKKGN